MTGGALQRAGDAFDRAGVALQRTGGALQKSGGALDRTYVASQRCMYVTSINDSVQILTFPGINNNRDSQNSRFICGELVFLNFELH